MNEFVGVQLTETLIDHLDIESCILHISSEEAKHQMLEQRQREMLQGDTSKIEGHHVSLVMIEYFRARAC